MSFIHFDKDKCVLCGVCIEECPFGVLSMGEQGIEVDDNCRMCGVCVRSCTERAIRFEQKKDSNDKNAWKGFLIFVEQEQGEIHPVTFELIGEAGKMAKKVGFEVNCVIIGSKGTYENAEKLLEYGVDHVYVYEHEGFAHFKADSYANAFADCITNINPSAVLIGATSLGRSLAPRLSTRFHTGLTADCTTLDIESNTDMIQIRPAFGGNIMAQIRIAHSRPQFATVRYRVLDKAPKTEHPTGDIVRCAVNDQVVRSGIEVLASELIEKKKAIEDAEIIVAVGRGVKSEESFAMCRRLADALGAQLAFSRPVVEMGIGDQLHQIGLSGHTVRPKLIITVGVSGAIQFTSCMSGAETIVAINNDPEARIFTVANYCIVDDLNDVVPQLTDILVGRKEN